jgi:tetratricopeptide (TPR) repeat protein
VLGGCAALPPEFVEVDARELDSVPFFPQTAFDCGPAALATILVHAGAATTPEALLPAVYVEGLQGSLQAELLAATRRRDLIPYPIAPTPEALLAEVDAGRPVLVLQNLGLPRVPVWHYAVVVGFDAERDRVVLRSGEERRRLEKPRRFLRSWERAAHWGFVAVAPDEVPASATPARFVRALVDGSNALAPEALDTAYASALAAWPDDPLTMFAAANHAQSRQRWTDAVGLYRRVLEAAPDAVARNNLAYALYEAGCADEALDEARAALAMSRPEDSFRAAIEDTVADLERRGPTTRTCAVR